MYTQKKKEGRKKAAMSRKVFGSTFVEEVGEIVTHIVSKLFVLVLNLNI